MVPAICSLPMCCDVSSGSTNAVIREEARLRSEAFACALGKSFIMESVRSESTRFRGEVTLL
jgi:hypothetical protein